MKFRDVKTIQHLLKEYGMTPGASTPVSSQQSGATAKANKSVTAPGAKPSLAKSQSPTMTPKSKGAADSDKFQSKGSAKGEVPQYVPQKLSDFEPETEIKDKDGKVVGIVKSPVGSSPKPEAVVIQDPRTKKFNVVEPDEEYFADNPEFQESRALKILNKDQKKHKLHRKIKRLIRKNSILEQGEEQLFEINFNKKEIAKNALIAPIKCGFEAETSWEDVYGGSEDDNWLDEYGWYDIEDMLGDQEGRRAVAEITDAYDEFISDKAMDLEGGIVEEMVDERREDEDYLTDFVEAEMDESDIEEYKENYLDGMDDDQKEEFEDWDFMAWGRQYVEEERMDEYVEYLEEMIRDSGEAMERAYDEARDDYDMDRWASYEYGSWNSTLAEFGYYLENPDGEGRGVYEVGEYLERWTDDNSEYRNVQSGEYHSSYGDTTQDYWRVETDSSISSYGTGAEIISPVYKTPEVMLKEMKSLFEWFKNHNVETNSSTGLHVTMSYAGKSNAELNELKLALLLGDKYLLSTFNRTGNSYTKSQLKGLEKMAMQVKSNPNANNLKSIEKILKKGLSRDKFSSINFKDQNDRSTENKLIEFRIGGGEDYHLDYDKIVKSVIRYSTVMAAAYDDEAFKKDYIDAIFRLINKATTISTDMIDQAKEDLPEDPAVEVLSHFFSKENYLSYMKKLSYAFSELNEYEKLSEPGADKEWKQSIKDYEKGTGRKFGESINEVEEGEPLRGYIEPDKKAPSERAPAKLESAQNYFVDCISQAGYDLNQNFNRKPVNAKAIGILRKTLPRFKLSYKELGEAIFARKDNVMIPSANYNALEPKTMLGRIKNGVDRLFRKEVVETPTYLSGPNVDKIIKGIWNALNSEKLDDKDVERQLNKKLGDAFYLQGRDDIVNGIKGKEHRQYSELYSFLMRGGDLGDYNIRIEPGQPAPAKSVESLIKYLNTTFDTWDHPVTKQHNPGINYGDDPYEDNALSKMMIRLRMRWDELDRVKEDDPAKYFDSVKEIQKSFEELLKTNSVDDGDGSGQEDYIEAFITHDLSDTVHQNNYDGEKYFGITFNQQKSANDILDDLVRNIDPFGDTPLQRLRDWLQNYLRRCFDLYYQNKKNYSDYYTQFEEIEKLVKTRTSAIAKFLRDFDKQTQDLGFDSIEKQIANKKQLAKKGSQFSKKHGPKYVATIDGFSYGGDIFVAKQFVDNLNRFEDRDIHRTLKFDNVHQSRHRDVMVVPNAHYFTALDAENILANDVYKGTWREKKAKEILDKWQDLYTLQFSYLDTNYVNINSDNVKKRLQKAKVEITDKLGDGRIGMGDFGPLLDKEELEGPYGEPFSPNSAVAWRVNNPDLAKKIKKDEKKRLASIDVQIPKAAGVEGMETYSSSTISDNTNWSDLADYLKIKRGVNDQGVELLKKVYDSFDSNHDWRPSDLEDPNACCMPRYVSAVKSAKRYIEKHYKVDAGNYFRDDEYVGGAYGGPDEPGNPDNPNLGEIDSIELTDTSYAEARGDYEKFDGMMQNGVGSYILQADANRLVKFLIGDFSERYKGAVLHAMIVNKSTGGEPVDIQQALALGKRILQLNPQYRESVFAKFDKLPLTEQLDLLSKIDSNRINKIYEISDFKKRELEYELRHEKDEMNYAVFINGKKWKVFKQRRSADKACDTLRAKGKDCYVKPTRSPVSEGGIRPEKPNKSSEEYLAMGYSPDSNKVKRAKEYEEWAEKNRDKVKEQDTIPRVHGGHRDLTTVADFIKDYLQNKKGSSVDLMLAVMKEFNIEDRRKAREIISFITRNDTLMGRAPARSYMDLPERKLSKKEIKKRDEYADDLPDKEFKKRYGKDWEAVKYGTATNMAKKVKESAVPDNARITKLLKLMNKPLLASDLKGQFEAFVAIPDPRMIRDFRGLRAQFGDNYDLRDLLKSYMGKLHKSDQKQLSESVIKEAPAELADKLYHTMKVMISLENDLEKACKHKRLASKCASMNAELEKIRAEVHAVRREIESYTATDADVDAAIKAGGEQKEIDIKRAKAGLKKQVLALVKKAEGIGDTPDEEVIFDKIQQSIADKLSSIIENVQDDESVKLESLTKLLDHAIAGELIDTKALVAAKKGRIDDHVNKNLEPDVIKVFDEYFKGDIFNFIPGGTTSGNYGPAEVGLAIFGNPANKAEVGDLEIDGTMFELKGSGYKSARKDGQGYTGLYGARLNSKGINSATAGWNALDKGIKKIVPDIGNVSKDTKGLEPLHLRFMNNGTKEASRYNLNAKGIELLNKEILEPYSNKQKTTELLMGAMKGIITGWKRVPDFDKIVAKMANDDGTISMQRLWSFYTGLAYESYNIEDDVENILFINSTTRSYYIINNRDEMIKAIASGDIQVKGGVSWNDDQQKASPQYAIA